MKRLVTLFAIGLAIAYTALVSGGGSVAAQDDPVRVTATFSILSDMVRNVGGDLVEVQSLVDANGDAHTFEPAPQDVATLAEADVIVQNGLNFEPWLDDVLDAAGTDALIVVVGEGITPRAATEEEHADEETHDHGEVDPHVWQSVANAIVMVETIRDALIEVDPDREDIYQANADAYVAELTELDQWIEEQIATLPKERRKLVTSHDTFGYYADRYGLEIIGTALGSLTTESADPPAGEIAALIEEIQASGIPAVFTENVQQDGLMQQIAENAGVELAPPLYSDALGPEDSAGATYLDMMRYNTETIVEALSG